MNRWFRNNFVKSLVTELFPSALYDSKKEFAQKPCSSKILTWATTKCFVISKGNIIYQLCVNYTRIIGANFKRSIFCSLTESVIRVNALWAFSNRNVTNDRGLFCKYEGIFSAYVLYPDENLTLSETYFLYNFGRNLKILISRNSLREQFLSPTNLSGFKSPLIPCSVIGVARHQVIWSKEKTPTLDFWIPHSYIKIYRFNNKRLWKVKTLSQINKYLVNWPVKGTLIQIWKSSYIF